MTKPAVILVGPLPPPIHGVTISTQRLLDSSLREKLDLQHLDTSDHRPMETVGTLDVRNVTLGLASYWGLLKLCLSARPAAIYVPISQTALGFIRDSVYLLVPRLLFGAAVVIHLRGGHFGRFYAGSNALMRWYIDLTMRCVERVIVLGRVFKPIFAVWIGDDRIDVVPNGTDLKIEGVAEKLRAPNRDGLTVTYMSNLVPTKGIEEFVRMACDVLRHESDVTFLVAGDWLARGTPEEQKVERLLDESGFRDRIHFLGEVRGGEKAALLVRTDVYVLPTYYPFEGQPNAIIEAMAAGCAVVSTDYAAIPETVIDGETGIIVPIRDVPALTAAVRRLCRDRDTLWGMAKASYARYRQGYTGEQSSDRVGASILRAISPADVH
jgi:glycosyltransferase involved in cell wall biosynthesis